MAGYYPKKEGDKVTFLNNFTSVLGPQMVTVGLAVGDMTALANTITAFTGALSDKVAKRGAALAATVTCEQKDKTAEEAVRAIVRRVKSSPGYTLALGRQLGIEGSGESPPSALVGGGPRPDLEATSVINGAVEIQFIKNGFSGVEIECQRGTDVSFQFLARDTESPYVDTRASVTDGPETRRYRGRYLLKDNPAADYSDVLLVTVPGRA